MSSYANFAMVGHRCVRRGELGTREERAKKEENGSGLRSRERLPPLFNGRTYEEYLKELFLSLSLKELPLGAWSGPAEMSVWGSIRDFSQSQITRII